MKHFLTCLGFTLSLTVMSAGAVLNQSGDATPKPPAPVAFVYVSQTPVYPGPSQVCGFTAAASGKLTPVAGSPFDLDVGLMAVNGKYLFGASRDGSIIDTYTIEPGGALWYKNSTNVGALTGNNDSAAASGWLALDHTGATLYQFWEGGSDGQYESFAVNKKDGTLAVTTNSAYNYSEGPLAISANNLFAFGTWPSMKGGWYLNTYKRDTFGSIHLLNQRWITIPAPKGQTFNPRLVATDPTNHLAAFLEPEQVNAGPAPGQPQLGVYTFDATGQLTSTSTYKNMPNITVGQGLVMRTSPSGKLLAVGGTSGVQVFHFNGANPITPFTTLAKGVFFTDVRWDNNNHLFALSYTSKLYVYTVTPTSVTQVAGSPYVVPGAQGLIVQPLN